MTDETPKEKPKYDLSKINVAKTDAVFLSQFDYEWRPEGYPENRVPAVVIHTNDGSREVQNSVIETLRRLGTIATGKHPGHSVEHHPLVVRGNEEISNLLNLAIDNPVIQAMQAELGIKPSGAHLDRVRK